jgi:hypothetical protein
VIIKKYLTIMRRKVMDREAIKLIRETKTNKLEKQQQQ